MIKKMSYENNFIFVPSRPLKKSLPDRLCLLYLNYLFGFRTACFILFAIRFIALLSTSSVPSPSSSFTTAWPCMGFVQFRITSSRNMRRHFHLDEWDEPVRYWGNCSRPVPILQKPGECFIISYVCSLFSPAFCIY